MAEAVAPPGRRVLAWAQEYGVYAAVGVLLLFNVLFTPTSSTWRTSAPSSCRSPRS